MTPDLDLTIGDGEEMYVLRAESYDGGWYPVLLDATPGVRVVTMPTFLVALRDAAPYPTPCACLEALFRGVVTELFGVRS